MLETAHREQMIPRSPSWKWWICVLLFLATVINYMDRQTLSQTINVIQKELNLTDQHYGDIELAFNVCFALGGLLVGWTADRWNVQWIFPLILLGWSAAGFATGYVGSFAGFLLCRSVLGVFEAGNWPCALKTTQRILPPAKRTLGNGMLQSGAAIGAVVTPLIIQTLVVGPGTWPLPFRMIGSLGTLWVFLWLASVRKADLAQRPPADPQTSPNNAVMQSLLLEIYTTRRFWICVVMAICINVTWHFFRVWLPLFLIKGRDYSPSAANYLTSAYYVAADVGSLAVGFASLHLSRRIMTVHHSRLTMFAVCMVLTSLSLVVAVLPSGTLLLGLLLIVGFGALGLFPVYYSLSQEITVQHQGKVTGALTCANWLVTGLMHHFVGKWLDETKNYSLVVGLAGVAPVIAFLALFCFWNVTPRASGEIGRRT